jgi:hypothetical protein
MFLKHLHPLLFHYGESRSKAIYSCQLFKNTNSQVTSARRVTLSCLTIALLPPPS